LGNAAIGALRVPAPPPTGITPATAPGPWRYPAHLNDFAGGPGPARPGRRTSTRRRSCPASGHRRWTAGRCRG